MLNADAFNAQRRSRYRNSQQVEDWMSAGVHDRRATSQVHLPGQAGIGGTFFSVSSSQQERRDARTIKNKGQRRLFLMFLETLPRSCFQDRKSPRLNSSHKCASRMPSSACK